MIGERDITGHSPEDTAGGDFRSVIDRRLATRDRDLAQVNHAIVERIPRQPNRNTSQCVFVDIEPHEHSWDRREDRYEGAEEPGDGANKFMHYSSKGGPYREGIL